LPTLILPLTPYPQEQGIITHWYGSYDEPSGKIKLTCEIAGEPTNFTGKVSASLPDGQLSFQGHSSDQNSNKGKWNLSIKSISVDEYIRTFI